MGLTENLKMQTFLGRDKKLRKKPLVDDFKAKRESVRTEGLTRFCTNSSYVGQWDQLGMSGLGYYSLFYGADFDGHLKNAIFNGQGTILYPNNARLEGMWVNGKMQAHRYIFSDKLCYGPYCEMPDRRFHLEIRDKLRPAGKSLLTNSENSRPIPEGCYDVGDGFYNPQKKCVYDVRDRTKIVRIPTKNEHEWIVKNCRKAWDETVGYRPDLYENWLREKLEDQIINKNEKISKRKELRKTIDYLSYSKTFHS